MNQSTWKRLSAPIFRRIKMMLTRAVVRMIDPATMMQELQVEAFSGELLDRVEHWEPYGFTSHPHPGAEALVASINGRRAHTVAVTVADRRYRPTGLEEGEVCLHTDEDAEDSDHRIVFKRGKIIHLIAGNSEIIMQPNLITLKAVEFQGVHV